MSASDVKRTAEVTAERVQEAARNPWLELAERLGYVLRGILYGLMGLLALGIPLRLGGRAVDQKGSLGVVAGQPFGRPALMVFALGLSAYALWGFVRALYDPLRRGDDPDGISQRLGFAWSGLAYSVLVVFALQLMVGAGGASDPDGVRGLVVAVFHHPAGRWASGAAGLLAVAVGVGQFVEAYRAGFRNDLKRREMTEVERRAADALGRFGMGARGVIFTIVGWFLLDAGLSGDGNRARGLGAAFLFLLGQPFGQVLLGVTALGFVALGLHSFACARWIKLLRSRR